MMTTRMPEVGDDVLYVSYGTPAGEYKPESRAAKVTAVGAWITVEDTWPTRVPGGPPVPPPLKDDRRTLRQRWDPAAVTLFVMNPGGLFLNPDRPVEYHSGCDQDGDFVAFIGGTWHWTGDEPR